MEIDPASPPKTPDDWLAKELDVQDVFSPRPHR